MEKDIKPVCGNCHYGSRVLKSLLGEHAPIKCTESKDYTRHETMLKSNSCSKHKYRDDV